jgi:hypothetical protein
MVDQIWRDRKWPDRDPLSVGKFERIGWGERIGHKGCGGVQDAASSRPHRQENARVRKRHETPMVDVPVRYQDGTEVWIGCVFQAGNRWEQLGIGFVRL